MSVRPPVGADAGSDASSGARGTPGKGEIEAALESVLASSVFAQAGRSRELLRFVVTEALAGRGDRLKGYTIAVEVFGRSVDFDAQADPLVRVEAGRLRKRLADYYHGAGRNDAVRIALPRGGYEPAFESARVRPALIAARRDSTASLRPTSPRRWPYVALAVLAIAFFAVVAVLVGRQSAPDRVVGTNPVIERRPIDTALKGGSDAIRLLVMPLRDLSERNDIDGFAAGFTEELVSALVAYDVVAIASPAEADIESLGLPQLRAQYGAGYVLTGSVRIADGVARVSLRLIDAKDGTLFWTSTFDETLGTSNAIAAQEGVARHIAGTLASYLGPIYSREVAHVSGKPQGELGSNECGLRYFEYMRSFDAALRADASACLERATVTDRRFVLAWAALATTFAHEAMFGTLAPAERTTKLDRALEASRMALDLRGTSRVAALSLATVMLARGERAAFGRAIERVLELKPAHSGITATTGFLLVLAGDYDRGLIELDTARSQLDRPPSMMSVGYALAYLANGRYEEALQCALKTEAADWPLAQLAKIAAAAHAQRTDLAARELRRLVEQHPDAAQRAHQWLEQAHIEPMAKSAIVQGLALAGLAVR